MRYDGYESAVTGHVNPFNTSTTSQPLGLRYALGGLYARIVDLPAEKATERGIFTDHVTRKELGRLNAFAVLTDALRWSHLYGGGAIVIVSDDGDLSQPLSLRQVKEVTELRAYSLPEISVGPEKYLDRLHPKYGQPTHYSINVNAAPVKIHETRIIPIPGDPLPRDMNHTGIPWAGRSSVLRAYEAIANYIEGQQLTVNIFRRKQQAIYSMIGLADAIKADQEALVQARVGLVDKARGVLNTVVVDTEDKYDLKDMNLNGVSDVLQEFQIAISSETGIPVTLLMGRSPAGMNATGAADFNTFYDAVRGDQRTKLTPALRRILEVIYAQPTIKSPSHWQKIDWVPLYSPSEEEQAKTAKTEAETLSIKISALSEALDRGFITQEQATQLLGVDNLLSTNEDA